MTLTRNDPHHWKPVPQVIQFLCDRLPPEARVLDVGAGYSPFPRADMYVDFAPVKGVDPEKVVVCDVSKDRLPFEDKSFDFVFCRHMLEDMFNPFPACEEMSRVAKSGYIETPSPVAELCRGVDGGAPAYRGYHHHRFIVWAHGEELRFISKYPLVEHITVDEGKLASVLRRGPQNWNTYYLWDDRINVNHIQSPLDFDIPTQYTSFLQVAINQSMTSTAEFWKGLPAQHEAA